MKEILKVPKYKPLKREYGLASLSMVLAYYGVNVSQEKIAAEIVLNGKDSYNKELIKYARSRGFFANPHRNASIDTIVQLLKKGIPPIASRRNGDDILEHCVVKGYDLENKIIYFNDPSNLRRTQLSFKNFRELWTYDSKNNSYIISVRPKK